MIPVVTTRQKRKIAQLLLGSMVIFFLSACDSNNEDQSTDSDLYQWDLPKGFPEPRVASEQKLTNAIVELGRFLFYDRRMSVNEAMSCADCHFQRLAFTDALETSVGTLSDVHPRNAMSLTNAVYNASQNWANPVTITLQSQAMGPMFGETPVELGWTGNETEILERFSSDPDYQQRFALAYPQDAAPVNTDNVIDAIAGFGSTLISGNSPFDRSTYHAEKDALSDSAKRGMDLFFSERLECFHCHGGFNFSSAVDHDGLVFEQIEFHNNGLYNVDGKGSYPPGNQGLFDITADVEDKGKFKAPTLRNIELTAPYMHDGSLATLDEVVQHYARGGSLIETGVNAGDGAKSPLKSNLIGSFQISEQETKDLIAFLKSLTDKDFICDPRFIDPFGNIAMDVSCP